MQHRAIRGECPTSPRIILVRVAGFDRGTRNKAPRRSAGPGGSDAARQRFRRASVVQGVPAAGLPDANDSAAVGDHLGRITFDQKQICTVTYPQARMSPPQAPAAA
jgi:hypothetical protein